MKLETLQTKTFKPLSKGWIKYKLNKWLIGLLILSSLMGGGYFNYRQITISVAQKVRSKMLTVPVERET